MIKYSLLLRRIRPLIKTFLKDSTKSYRILTTGVLNPKCTLESLKKLPMPVVPSRLLQSESVQGRALGVSVKRSAEANGQPGAQTPGPGLGPPPAFCIPSVARLLL